MAMWFPMRIPNGWWPQSQRSRVVLYVLTAALVVVVGILSVRYFRAKGVEDCNKPAAPVVVPEAPPGLIVDAPCTDGTTPAKAPSERKR